MTKSVQPIISLSTGSTYHLGLSRTFEIASKAGFKYLELILRAKKSDNPDNGWCDSWDPAYLKGLQAKHKIKIISLHSPVDFEFFPREYLPEVKSLAKELSIKHIVIHACRKEKYAIYNQWFRDIFTPEHNSRAEFLIENMETEDAKDLDGYRSLCFDITHVQEKGIDPEKMSLQLADRIREFHISYFDGTNKHRNFLSGEKKLIGKILAAQPQAIRCVELFPDSFSDMHSEDIIVAELAKSRILLESV